MYEIVKSYRTKEITTANPKHKKSKDGICLIQEKYNKISLENRMLFEFQNFDFIVYNINKCKTWIMLKQLANNQLHAFFDQMLSSLTTA